MLIAATTSASPDWPTIVAAVSLLFAAIAAGSAAWAIREARASGRDLKAAAETLSHVLNQTRHIADLQNQTVTTLDAVVSQERANAAEARLRHRLERLVAVMDALSDYTVRVPGLRRQGTVARYVENSDDLTTDELREMSDLMAVRARVVMALLAFPDELPAVTAQVAKDLLHADEGDEESRGELGRLFRATRDQLQRLAGNMAGAAQG